jgi:hypothetical protein
MLAVVRNVPVVVVAAVAHWSPVPFRRLLRRMLSCDVTTRPALQQCLDELRAITDADGGAVNEALRQRVRELEAIAVRRW